jgi:DNA-binding CsgD family transcriptional regulator
VSHGSSRRPGRNVFVGRENEVAALRAAWRSARNGSARVVAVEGDPGIGKTALIDVLLAGSTAPVIRVTGVQADSLTPWTVLDEIMARLPATRPTSPQGIPVAALVPRLKRQPRRDPQASPGFVGQGLTEALQVGGQLALLVDDAQWADRASMAALQYAARRLRDDPVLLILAYRSHGDGSLPEYMTVSPGLSKAWRQVFDGEHGVHLALDGLPPEDLLRLAAVNGYLGLSPEGAGRLHESTGGNPGHVLELLELLPMHAIVTGSGPLPAPRGLAHTINARLAACSRQTRDLVAGAAVLGQRFSVAALREVTGRETTGAPIAEAIDAGLLAEVPGTGGRELAFAQVLTREAIYQDLGRGVRARLHERCALLGGPAALQHRIAAADGPDERLAADLRRAAQEQRMAAQDIPRAAAYLRQALDSSPPGPARLSLMLATVESLLVAGDAVAAREYEGELAAAPRGPWRDYVLAYQTLLNGRIAEATALFQEALAALGKDISPASGNGTPLDLRARIATQLAITGILSLSYPEMVEYGSAAVAAGSSEPWVSGFARFAQTVGMALAGNSAGALALLADIGEPGEEPGLEGVVARGLIRLWTDNLDGAAHDLHTAVQRATRGEVLRVSQALGFLGEVEYRRGMLGEAVLFTDLAAGNAEDNDRFWDFCVLHALATYPHAARAEWAEADHHAAQSATWARTFGASAGLAFAAAAKAAIAQGKGDPQRLLAAATQIEAHYDSLEPGTHLFGPARADALAQLGRIDEAAEALDRFLATAARSGRKSALMSAARVAAQIAAARKDHDRAQQECERAASLARAIGLPLEAGRIGLVAARCHHLAGRRAAAERALRAARKRFIMIGANAYRQLADRCAAELGIMVDDRPDPFKGLTQREQDIALLVCQGLSNKQIAERLYLSPKTVETHLTRAFTKLDVSARGDLKGLLDAAE